MFWTEEELATHNCQRPLYERSRYAGTGEENDDKCVCGKPKPDRKHLMYCFFCKQCSRWSTYKTHHETYCQTSRRGPTREAPHKRMCPFCRDYLHKNALRKHVEKVHPGKELAKLPKGRKKGSKKAKRVPDEEESDEEESEEVITSNNR